MFGKVSPARHAAVAGSIGVTTALTGLGVMASGGVTFDAWQVYVRPLENDSVRVTYVIDQDFGSNEKHGFETFIPDDFGQPTDFEVSSPDAPDQFDVQEMYESDQLVTRLRIGDPNQTISGQHRYQISFTYPDAKLDSGVLSIDLASSVAYKIDSFDVLVTGFDLNDPKCFMGANGSTDECAVTSDSDGYHSRIDNLAAGDGVTFEGDIVGGATPARFVANPLPPRRRDNRLDLTAAMGGMGLLGAVPVYLLARRRGANEVYAGGPTEAAMTNLPPPTADGNPARLPTRKVPDADMPALATTEFVPPKGIAPWQGQVLLSERFDQSTVEAWFSGLAGANVITVGEHDRRLIIGSGPRRGQLASPDKELLDQILGRADPYVTGTYDPAFAQAWSAIAASQRNRLAAMGWWKRFPPGMAWDTGGFNLLRFLGPLVIFGFVIIAQIGASAAGLFKSPVLAFLVGLVFPAIVAYFMYRELLPARSATGSAVTLQTESFRRFLHASEAQHVEWAYSKGLLREYSGWAVALGEAAAWSNALGRANVPEPARIEASPLFVHMWFPSVVNTRTPPPPTGGSGGAFGGGSGGFRGGSVGGGGGGMGGGSW